MAVAGFRRGENQPEYSRVHDFLPDHQNYYKNDMERYFSDKANIYRWQKRGDWLIAGSGAPKVIKEKDKNGAKWKTAKMSKKNIPHGWKIKLLGYHNLINIALAVEVALKTRYKRSSY